MDPTGGHYALLQSRQAFRYQPGRISGYTFGTRATLEKTQVITMQSGGSLMTLMNMYSEEKVLTSLL